MRVLCRKPFPITRDSDMKYTVFCTECKGTNVQIAGWVNPNTGENCEHEGRLFDTVDEAYDFNFCWCMDCQGSTLLDAMHTDQYEAIVAPQWDDAA